MQFASLQDRSREEVKARLESRIDAYRDALYYGEIRVGDGPMIPLDLASRRVVTKSMIELMRRWHKA